MLPIIKQQKDAQEKLTRIAKNFITEIEVNNYIGLIESLVKRLEEVIAETDLKNFEAEQLWKIVEEQLIEKQKTIPNAYDKMLLSNKFYAPVWNLFVERHNSRIKQMEFKKEMELYED